MLTLVPSSFSLAAGFLRPPGRAAARVRLGSDGGPAPGLGPTAIWGKTAAGPDNAARGTPPGLAGAAAAGTELAAGSTLCDSSPGPSSGEAWSGTATADRQ